MESSVCIIYCELIEVVKIYNNLFLVDGQVVLFIGNKDVLNCVLLVVKKFMVKLGIYCELELDSFFIVFYVEEDIQCIENFVEELVNEKIIGQLYIMGIFYEFICIIFSVYVMVIELIVYSLLVLDKLCNCVDGQVEKYCIFFIQCYLEFVCDLVICLLVDLLLVFDELICCIIGIIFDEFVKVYEINKFCNIF